MGQKFTRLLLLMCGTGCAIQANPVTDLDPELNEVLDTTLQLSQEEILRLTEEDFEEAAKALDVDVATIKAVIEIEAGPAHQGFYAPHKPLINFDLKMFNSMASKHKFNLNKYRKTHAEVFTRPNKRKYGSHQAAQQARLEQAMTIHPDIAIEGTFWGMFQIGGFNWKKCGAESLEDFVERMSTSEREQLMMFVEFIKNSGMQPLLKKKDWTAFARKYNGAGYARRGYHTRLAKAYAKFSKAAATESSTKGTAQ